MTAEVAPTLDAENAAARLPLKSSSGDAASDGYDSTVNVSARLLGALRLLTERLVA